MPTKQTHWMWQVKHLPCSQGKWMYCILLCTCSTVPSQANDACTCMWIWYSHVHTCNMQVAHTRLAYWLTGLISGLCMSTLYIFIQYSSHSLYAYGIECFNMSLLICSLSGPVHLFTLHKYSVKWSPVLGHVSIRTTCTYAVSSCWCTLPRLGAVNVWCRASERAH